MSPALIEKLAGIHLKGFNRGVLGFINSPYGRQVAIDSFEGRLTDKPAASGPLHVPAACDKMI
eukprot:scaffold297442_cov43-Tisochrysis_lutea.AAC.1